MDEQTTNEENAANAQADPEPGDESIARDPEPELGLELGPAETPEELAATETGAPEEQAPAETPETWDPAPVAPPETAEELGEEPATLPEPATLVAERDQWKDRHLRLAADFDNYRKRSEDRMRSRWDRAQADLAGRLLEPLDDLERLAGWEGEVPEPAVPVVEGAALVGRKFSRILEDAGVSVVDPAGERFDPNTMEAMMRVPAEAAEDDEKVERVFQKGYVFKGQLLRPARVSVYKAE